MPGKKNPFVDPWKLPSKSPAMTGKKNACPTAKTGKKNACPKTTDFGPAKPANNFCNTKGCRGRTVDPNMYCIECRSAHRSLKSGEDKKLTQRSKKEVAKEMGKSL